MVAIIESVTAQFEPDFDVQGPPLPSPTHHAHTLTIHSPSDRRMLLGHSRSRRRTHHGLPAHRQQRIPSPSHQARQVIAIARALESSLLQPRKSRQRVQKAT